MSHGNDLITDEQLAVQARHDMTAFAELYHRYIQRIYRYALVMLKDPQEAQDVTSQTFLAALERIHQYRIHGPFAAWLFGITKRKTVDYFRHQRKHVTLEAAATVPLSTPPLDDIVGTKIDVTHIIRVLQSISPERCEAFALRFIAELSIEEVSVVLGKANLQPECLFIVPCRTFGSDCNRICDRSSVPQLYAHAGEQ